MQFLDLPRARCAPARPPVDEGGRKLRPIAYATQATRGRNGGTETERPVAEYSLVQMSTGIAERGMTWKGADKPVPLPVRALDHATGGGCRDTRHHVQIEHATDFCLPSGLVRQPCAGTSRRANSARQSRGGLTSEPGLSRAAGTSTHSTHNIYYVKL